MKKCMIASCYTVIPALCLFLGGCAAGRPEPAPDLPVESAERTYAIVVKNTENPYMSVMYGGFQRACASLGAQAVLTGPGANGEPTQAEILETLIAEEVDAIAVAANDMEEVSTMLLRAMEAGIPIVSLDSMVNPDERNVHIQQASPEMIGRVLIQAAALIMDNNGSFAILTTTETMPNQASWLRWMHRELSEYPEKYHGMTLVETAYGMDEHGSSAEATRRLLRDHPDLSLIISPTTVGMQAAAGIIREMNAATRITGLGLPSEMEPFIVEGICPWMYLWNPSELGYLAAYAADALVDGLMTGAVDEILHAGELGEKIVTESEEGGTEIVLGHPKVFDLTNIAVWGDLF
ncbi:MAG: substrate-binding domain-containing protein [Clostridia bacterium]|nr:substrate-binding domain-containing protein [Clostridia bacterium]